MDSSEFLEFLSSRSSVREFTGAPVSSGEVLHALDCASTAPSAGNLEAWDVVVVSDAALLGRLAAAAYGQQHVHDAAVVFVVCANYARSMDKYGERGMFYATMDAAIACTYLMLALHTQAIQSCWTGAFDEDKVASAVALPDHLSPIALLAAGYGLPPVVQTGRMAVWEHVHWNRW
ncbi:MAG: nitroreductase family protein [Methanomicrobiales archaeon]|jgi:nitroreductase|nr:nitroreductase family protein [Methanomicrobiales archaeon]